MSGRLLSFANYLGQANNVQVIEMFPSTQKSFTYDFSTSIVGYTFEADYQTIVLDTVTYDRTTGNPNFTDTNVTGYFANAEISNSYIDTSTLAAGTVKFTIPSQRYTGPITPDARTNVAMTVVGFKWTDTNVTPNVTNSHRWGVIERWEPDVSPGDPTLSNAFIRLGVGGISTFSNDSTTDASRTAGTYNNISGLSSGDGTGAVFQIVVAGDGSCAFNITTRGTGYVPGETIEILDSALGGGGGADITVTVTTTT